MKHETLTNPLDAMRPGKTPGSFYGTSRVGFLNMTRAQIEAAFGAPTEDHGDCPMDDKVWLNWGIRFEDGTIATIYDYKTPNAFRVGAFEDDGHALALVCAALGVEVAR